MSVQPLEITIANSKGLHIEGALICRRQWLWKFHIIIIALLLCATFGEVVSGDSPLKGAIFAFVMFLCVYLGAMAVHSKLFIKRVTKVLDAAKDGPDTYSFRDDMIMVSSPRGEGAMSWNTIKIIASSDSTIVFILKTSHFIPLPVSELRPEIKASLKDKIMAHRIKLTGRQAKKLVE
jgi:hypothetical protein